MVELSDALLKWAKCDSITPEGGSTAAVGGSDISEGRSADAEGSSTVVKNHGTQIGSGSL